MRAEAPHLLGRKPQSGSPVANETREFITARSGGCCEYCQMHQSLQGATFHVEHVIPRVRGGVRPLISIKSVALRFAGRSNYLGSFHRSRLINKLGWIAVGDLWGWGTFGDTTYFWGVVFNPPQNVVSPSCTHSVEQLSSTVSEASTNFTSDKRLGQSFYNMVDYVADLIEDVTYVQLYRRGKAGTPNPFGRLLLVFEDTNHVMHPKFPVESGACFQLAMNH